MSKKDFLEFDYSLFDEDDDFTNENGAYLSEVPLALLQNSIEIQFQEPLEYRKKDYIQDFIDKYEFSKANENENDEISVEELHDQFIAFITKAFKKYLNLGFPDIEDKDYDEQHELIHACYLFFIKSIKKNFVSIICNEIEEYKEYYASLNPINDDSITPITFKEEIDDEEDINILSNLNVIVAKILSKIKTDYTVEMFFEMTDNKEVNITKEFIKYCFDTYDLTGNFILKYADMVDDEFSSEIESKVRNHILKKYPFRKTRKEPEIEDDESNIEK